jgi:putative membrane protein
MTTYRKILLLIFVCGVCVSLFGAQRIENWLLESIPSLVGVALVTYFNKKAQWSDFSFTLILIYFSLPLVNAHYNVSDVPFGDMLGHWFHADRNPYDRLVHFSSGLLCTYPLYELCTRIRGKKDIWNYILPFVFILAISCLYEISEWLVSLVQPREGAVFVGAQGDVFDSPKDMTCAAVGSILTTMVMFFILKSKKK